MQYVGHRAVLIQSVELSADDVKRGSKIRPAVAKEYPDVLADVRRHGTISDERIHRAIEHHIRRLLIHRFIHVETLQAFLAELARGVKLALHDVILSIHRRQTFLRLDENQTIHPTTDVHANRRRRAVINKKAGMKGLERELRRMPRRGKRRSRATARPADRVQVNAVRHLVVLMVVQVELHLIAFADANETSRHVAAKRPKDIINPIRQTLGHLFDLQIDDYFRGEFALEGRRNIGRLRKDGGFHAADSQVNQVCEVRRRVDFVLRINR